MDKRNIFDISYYNYNKCKVCLQFNHLLKYAWNDLERGEAQITELSVLGVNYIVSNLVLFLVSKLERKMYAVPKKKIKN